MSLDRPTAQHGSLSAATEGKQLASLALVIPAYNEAEMVETLVEALCDLRETWTDVRIRIVIVDDHSIDATPSLLHEACRRHDWCTFLRLSRRSGSHAAIIAGLDQCDEDFAAFIAADLQDPPHLLREMLVHAQSGHDVVWAVRSGDDERGVFEQVWSNLFHALMKRISTAGVIPYRASFALLSRRAYRELVANSAQRSSLIVEIPRLGYSVATIAFAKQKRRHGTSKWKLGQKLLALVDAAVDSSYLPLRGMAYAGIVVSFLGLLWAALLVVLWTTGKTQVQGWTSLMVVVLLIGGLQMLMLGVIGEYLWRTNENSRRRTLYLIEDGAGLSAAVAARHGIAVDVAAEAAKKD